MEESRDSNVCGVNQLDADARLPPRKRLLAGLKKQTCDGASPSSPLLAISSDMSNRLRDLLSSHLNNSNASTEEIVEASRSAAESAAKVAAAARAAAEEKAALAAKAVAAAKSALELVAAFSVRRSRKERGLRKDKTKDHVPVQVLYKKRKRREKGETDEELARRLHQVMNSSPRISKSSTSSDPTAHDHKKHKKRLTFEKTTVSNGGSSFEEKLSATSDIEAGKPVRADNMMVEPDDKASECTKTDCFEMGNGHDNSEAEGSHSEQVLAARKRGRIKQKKLSLSQCTVRDRESSKGEPKTRGLQSVKTTKNKPKTTVDPLVAVEPSTEEESPEAVSKWPRKEFNAPQCYGGNNILRSLCSNPTVTTGSAMVEVDQ
ncbi:hypothetical protein ACHQM5_024337 [Ranunculus cassubicifolius]